jgi:DNA helicase II / ATP-dependent DNA helicase PcrA
MVDFGSQIDLMVNSMLTLENLWKLNNFEPNDQQEEAIRHVDGPLYITAGPGSGKTRVLLWRAVNLIVFHGVKPEEIYLSTFTEKAAHQLQEGLRGLLGYATNINGQPYDLSKMYIGTVHSLCRRILTDRRKFLQDFHANPMPSLMDELSQYFHVSKSRNWERLGSVLDLGPEDNQNDIINDIFETNRRSKHAAVTSCISFFNRCSEECIDPSNAIEQIENGDDALLDFFQESDLEEDQLIQAFKLYQAYLDSLQRSEKLRSTDFSLLQQEAYQVLHENDGSEQVFRHVIIDEYQDTNTIQEKIFFKLAQGHKNICVVGDDDQALYRFRGATVENFVEFPQRCQKYLNLQPKRISLSKNYRSRKKIVDFYSHFMDQADWEKHTGEDGFYRVMDKDLQAHRSDKRLSVVASTPGKPENVCAEIAHLVRDLVDQGKVEDPNQVAFLYPSLKTVAVERMQRALEEVGLRVYAPRAGKFLEVDESYDVFGLISLILGLPEIQGGWGGDYGDFVDWMGQVEGNAKDLTRQDPALRRFVIDKREEVSIVCRDFEVLKHVVEKEGWSFKSPYDPDRMQRKLYNAPGFSDRGRKLLGSRYLYNTVKRRIKDGYPFSLEYIVKRVTSLDWSLLDLFYRLTGFSHFKEMFDLAERGEDEGPVCNLSLITQYLARFTDEFISMLTADLIVDGIFHRVFYFSFLFAIYRLGESEYEDAEDPFPKGRIPFLTIHQAKGLEFPVVVLGNPRRTLRDPDFIERAIFPFSENKNGEPLSRQAEFDTMRIFYVALSRAQNLLILTHFKGRGQVTNEPFKTLLDDHFPRIPQLDLSTVPAYEKHKTDLPKMYSYTADFLLYSKCPRQYMAFRKYEFVPSRAQTMFFGSLVHRTLEDLHHEIIRRRGEGNDGN